MTKTISLLAMALLFCGSVLAAPVALSNAELDKVTAGASVFDYVFGSTGTINQASDEGATTAADASFSAADNGSNAVTGEGNEVTSALASNLGVANNGNRNDFNTAMADHGANAVSGNDNIAVAANLTDNTLTIDASNKEAEDGSALATDQGTVYQNKADDTSAVATDTAEATVKDYAAIDNDHSNVVVGEGSGNQQSIDATVIDDAEIERGSVGQIGKTVTADNSFNYKEVEIDVDVDIDDSFNTTTNEMCIGGQGSLTAIANANALDDQNIGVNVNITSAESGVPTTSPAGNEGAVESFSGNAISVSLLNQMALNNVLIVGNGVTDGGIFPGLGL